MHNDKEDRDVDAGPTDEWRQLRSKPGAKTLDDIAQLVRLNAPVLADSFYTDMLGDPEAGRFLDHRVVEHRLHDSMVRWLEQMFAPDTPIDDLRVSQRHIGEVHARIDLPIDLVARAARLLKRRIAACIEGSEMGRSDLVAATQYIYEHVDMALDVMNAAYVSNTNRMARSAEAYRLFFLGQNMRAERERHRSELLEWAQQILMRYYGDSSDSTLPELGNSQFGLWFQHKASMLFEGAPEMGEIRAAIDNIEHVLLPLLGSLRNDPSRSRPVIAALNERIELIKRHLGAMYDRFMDSEDGRDVATNLLNRRYFPTVAAREIAYAREHDTCFAVLQVGIDNPPVDAAEAERAAAHVARMLVEHVRAGDFVFRVAAQEFIVTLVEVQLDTALRVADGLREHIGAAGTSDLEAALPPFRVSVGVALWDGHPDYERLLDRAAHALATARSQGGDCCAAAGPQEADDLRH